jgi:hypothetical protein
MFGTIAELIAMVSSTCISRIGDMRRRFASWSVRGFLYHYLYVVPSIFHNYLHLLLPVRFHIIVPALPIR